jgi:hypothetical protein
MNARIEVFIFLTPRIATPSVIRCAHAAASGLPSAPHPFDLHKYGEFGFNSSVVAPDSSVSVFAPATSSPVAWLAWERAAQTVAAGSTAKFPGDGRILCDQRESTQQKNGQPQAASIDEGGLGNGPHDCAALLDHFAKSHAFHPQARSADWN